uniref:Uncharacterized protein n=1 Tax=Oryctolagus cuniculus TaxID=9986 RepID=A0A5F9CV14_RABIT
GAGLYNRRGEALGSGCAEPVLQPPPPAFPPPPLPQVMAQPGSGCKATTRCLEGTAPPAMAQSDAEALAGTLDKDEGRASPCTPSTPSVCSPPSAASSVPSAGKNICSSCGLEILDRYLLKCSVCPVSPQGRPRAQTQAAFATCALRLQAPASRARSPRAPRSPARETQPGKPRAPGRVPVPAQVPAVRWLASCLRFRLGLA